MKVWVKSIVVAIFYFVVFGCIAAIFKYFGWCDDIEQTVYKYIICMLLIEYCRRQVTGKS